ncbi:hypothetical protein ACFYXF_47580 [Streptomyces sp. NPDC002680]|uniref:hypothetical protein n=1 Tax=Streptomyces sp. NPDC002680 TaxID=3364659 RepID=UPI00369BF1B3
MPQDVGFEVSRRYPMIRSRSPISLPGTGQERRTPSVMKAALLGATCSVRAMPYRWISRRIPAKPAPTTTAS